MQPAEPSEKGNLKNPPKAQEQTNEDINEEELYFEFE